MDHRVKCPEIKSNQYSNKREELWQNHRSLVGSRFGKANMLNILSAPNISGGPRLHWLAPSICVPSGPDKHTSPSDPCVHARLANWIAW